MENNMRKNKNYEVRCQNCIVPLAKFIDNNLNIPAPCEVENFEQELTPDTTLITLKCPNCGCFLQVKI